MEHARQNEATRVHQLKDGVLFEIADSELSEGGEADAIFNINNMDVFYNK